MYTDLYVIATYRKHSVFALNLWQLCKQHCDGVPFFQQHCNI